MSGDLRVFNRQRAPTVDSRRLRSLILSLLEEGMKLEEFDLAVHLVGERAMAKCNEKYLGHKGTTDVITLDYGDNGPAGAPIGEIFVCVDEALAQGRQFRVPWQEELVRYIIHGILHLRGHDDRDTQARRRMKREEGRWLKKLDGSFHLSKPARKTRVTSL
jgi:probable rRNA maturation factor